MSGISEENPEGLGPQGLPASGRACLATMDKKLNVLTEKVDRLLYFQEDVTEKLQCVRQGMDHLEQGLHRLEASRELGLAGPGSSPPATVQAGWPEVLELVRAVRQEGAQHGARLEALFKMVVAVDRALTLVGSTFQNSKVDDFIMQGTVPWRNGSLADGPEEVGSGFPALARVVSGDPDGEHGQEMILYCFLMYSVSCCRGNERWKFKDHRWISTSSNDPHPLQKRRR